MQLHDVHQGVHRRKKRKRIGRGLGSGHGKTSSKGHKGHASRQGFKLSPIFEGGQMPLARRMAKFEPGAVVDEKTLRSKGLVKGQDFDGIKILGNGALTKRLEVHATKFSGSAAAKIEAAGGKTFVVPYRPHAVHARSDSGSASSEA
jgi:large subunit ribosomal protein L15